MCIGHEEGMRAGGGRRRRARDASPGSVRLLESAVALDGPPLSRRRCRELRRIAQGRPSACALPFVSLSLCSTWLSSDPRRAPLRSPGDPVRAAEAIITVVESEDPPLNLVLGAPGLKAVREKIATLSAELDRWEELTLSADFPDGTQ